MIVLKCITNPPLQIAQVLRGICLSVCHPQCGVIIICTITNALQIVLVMQMTGFWKYLAMRISLKLPSVSRVHPGNDLDMGCRDHLLALL